jgi:RNA polymerase sigma-70 factor (ECF subfamily)
MALAVTNKIMWQSARGGVSSMPAAAAGDGSADAAAPAVAIVKSAAAAGVTDRGAALKPTVQQFEQLALEQLDTLYRVARRLARDPSRAEDLVQETYVRALRARETFDLKAHGIRPWLLRIMHNVHVSRAEREVRQPAAVVHDQLEAAPSKGTAGAGAGGDASGVWNLGSFDSMDERLVHAIESLAPEYQVVLMLWAVDELSYKEIADACGIPIGTVMSRLYRARQRLSEQLRSYATREGIIRE